MTDGSRLLAAAAGELQPLLLGAAVERGAALGDFHAAEAAWGRGVDLPLFFTVPDKPASAGGPDPLWFSGYPKVVDDLGADAMYCTVSPQNGPLSACLDGSWDTWIAREAARAKAYGRPVLLRLAHEFNGTWNKYGASKESPEQFVAAWRYLANSFRALGATNLQWMWCPNSWTAPGDATTASPVAWWPGDDVVDFVGLDAYCSAKSPKILPRDLIWDNYLTLTALSPRPFMLGEFGVAGHRSGVDRAQWYRELGLLLAQMPRCVAALQWQRTATADQPDYSHDSSGTDPTGGAAFVELVNHWPFTATELPMPTLDGLTATFDQTSRRLTGRWTPQPGAKITLSRHWTGTPDATTQPQDGALGTYAFTTAAPPGVDTATLSGRVVTLGSDGKTWVPAGPDTVLTVSLLPPVPSTIRATATAGDGAVAVSWGGTQGTDAPVTGVDLTTSTGLHTQSTSLDGTVDIPGLPNGAEITVTLALLPARDGGCVTVRATPVDPPLRGLDVQVAALLRDPASRTYAAARP